MVEVMGRYFTMVSGLAGVYYALAPTFAGNGGYLVSPLLA